MSDLLDANVLIALTVADHVHHDVVEEWFGSTASSFATGPITQMALLRSGYGPDPRPRMPSPSSAR